jgi:hypothetical protein
LEPANHSLDFDQERLAVTFTDSNESIGNLTPVDVCLGRGDIIMLEGLTRPFIVEPRLFRDRDSELRSWSCAER